MPKVLIIGDQQNSCLELRSALESDMEVLTAHTLPMAWSMAAEHLPDVVLSDCYLQGEAAAEQITKIRDLPKCQSTSFAFYSKSAGLKEKQHAYQNGAIDFISIPSDPVELKLRMTALARQAALLKCVPPHLYVANMVLFPMEKKVFLDSKEVKLTTREFSILYLLSQKKDTIVTSNELLEKIWGNLNISSGNLYTQIYNLKRKLTGLKAEIQTLHRVGVKLVEKA
jgi:two-component system response regulator CiaR